MALSLSDVLLPIQRITFKGQPFLLIPIFDGGAIATPEAYESFEESYAHLFADGSVLRHGVPIGTRDDIEVLGPYENDLRR